MEFSCDEDHLSTETGLSKASTISKIQHLMALQKEDDELLRFDEMVENESDDDGEDTVSSSKIGDNELESLPDTIRDTDEEVPLLLQRGINRINLTVESSDDEEEEDETIVAELRMMKIFTLDEILFEGLRIIGYTEKRINRAKKVTNVERFKAHFGSIPTVVALIWEDLQICTTTKDAWVPPSRRNFKHFLMALHHLKRYPTELEREAIFDISMSYAREWVWYFVVKIRNLKSIKITWPDGYNEGDVWVCTVDGTHCWLEEPTHPTWSQDSDFYSHKYARAGMNYELAISLTESRLIWMNGPFKAGANDVSIFKKHGLKNKLTQLGQMAIGDGGYSGHPKHISAPNKHDALEVKRFKSRALKRHERFNGYTKAFDCISGRFRHSTERFADCFEAVCVICQYQVENGFDLYDILIEDMLYEI